jgi:hypothetical protein
MNLFIKKVFIFIVFISVMSFPLIGKTQAPNPIDSVSISIDPETPIPGKNATIKLVSYNIDLNSSNIVWQVGGKTVSKGVGIYKLNIIAPPIGKVSNVIATISTIDGREIKKGINVKSSDTDLVWETDGFIPPFFEGKSLFSYQNTIKIIAIPHLMGTNGKEADPRLLSYKWTVNSRVMQDQSGYGKQVLQLRDELPVDLSIEVEILSRDGNQKSVANISLAPGDPSISLYEEDPLYGVYYNIALTDSKVLKNNELSVLSVPYYFNKKKNTDLSRVWSINGIEQTDLKNNDNITLRTNQNSEGKSKVSLEIRGSDNILQGAKKEIDVFFNKLKKESNITF